MHDGLYGPKNMYAYLCSNGNWFKSVWDDVVMVSEEAVVNDKAGLHLNSGPYMLVYSSEVEMPPSALESPKAYAPFWSDHHLNTVKEDNVALRSRLTQRVQGNWWGVAKTLEEDFWVNGELERADPLASWTPEDPTVDETSGAFVPSDSPWGFPDTTGSQRGESSSMLVTRDSSPAPSPQFSDAEMDDVTSHLA